jgi:hypothetical protein
MLFDVNQRIEENSPTKGNTKTNLTSKTTTTVHPGKQNEGEKQIFLCVSTKICHLTHFTRLA